MPQFTTDELLESLDTQVGFLKTSIAAYDAGDGAESLRIAAAIRVIAWTKGRSKSILTQLGIQDTMKWHDFSTDGIADALSRSMPVDPDEPPDSGDVTRYPQAGIFRHRLMFDGPDKIVGYAFEPGVANRGFARGRAISYDEWWNGTVTDHADGSTFSRGDYVLGHAHKDGGTHLDADIDAAYRKLTRGGLMKARFAGDGHRDGIYMVSRVPVTKDIPADFLHPSPVPAAVRHIATEVLQSVDDALVGFAAP